MSLLSPDRLYGALFPGAVTLRRKRHGAVDSALPTVEYGADSLLSSLGALLQIAGKQALKGKSVSLLTSDSLGVFAVLPWQESLRTREELSVYATACFEKQGIAIDEGWVMHADFKDYGREGLAFAVRRDWMEKLLALLTEHELKLHRVLPVTAASFWMTHRLPRVGHELLLLSERKRVSVCVYDPGGLRSLDVEVVTGREGEAVTRLLRRTSNFYGEVSSVRCWTFKSEPEATVADCVAACFPDASVTTIEHDAWAIA